MWLRTQVYDFATGIVYLKAAADLGHGPSSLTLGKLFHDGVRVERDMAAAMRLFQQAAAEGDAAGWNSLGVCHEEMGNSTDAQKCYRSLAVFSIDFMLNAPITIFNFYFRIRL